jgi:hypothetical protein
LFVVYAFQRFKNYDKDILPNSNLLDLELVVTLDSFIRNITHWWYMPVIQALGRKRQED